MESDKETALRKEIKELKKERRGLEKKAFKSIRKLLASEESPEKKREQRRIIKKEMKAARVSTKKVIREKKKELGSA
jgi:hypothetical protein